MGEPDYTCVCAKNGGGGLYRVEEFKGKESGSEHGTHCLNSKCVGPVCGVHILNSNVGPGCIVPTGVHILNSKNVGYHWIRYGLSM
jgi:hypothetical protein